MRLDPPARSLVRPIRLFTTGLVDMAPWLPQCWMVRPIQAPPRPVRMRSAFCVQVLGLFV